MIKAFGFLLRSYSYLFHLALSLFLLGVASVSAASQQPLNLRMLPFAEDNMLSGVFSLGAIGLLVTLLALTRIFRYLFPLWAGLVLYLMVRGFFFSAYTFSGANALKTALWLNFGALIAFFGALWVLKVRRRRRRWW